MVGLLGLLVVAAGIWLWFERIDRVDVPRDRRPFFLAFIAGGLLGLVGLLQVGGVLNGLFGFFAAVAGFGFPALRLQSAQQPNVPAAQVGEPMPAFSAPDAEGALFDSAVLSGKPYLLKFFRGHW